MEFHGHLGPFLVLGVRMGLAGLRELKVKRGEKKLWVTAMLNYSIPISCALDGLQVATKCTLGNKKLRLLDSSGIAAKFELEDGKAIAKDLGECIECCACVSACPHEAIEHSSC